LEACKKESESGKLLATLAKLERQHEKAALKIAERDKKIEEAHFRAEEDRRDVAKVGEELEVLYQNPTERAKHACVVDLVEIEENEFNLNIPRYVDTFEPETHVKVDDALRALIAAEAASNAALTDLAAILKDAGYAD